MPLPSSDRSHPYIGRPDSATSEQRQRAITALNRDRDATERPAVIATYYLETDPGAAPLDGLMHAARMALEHGTVKPWHESSTKPYNFDRYMSWATDIRLLEHSADIERGLVSIAWPVAFFDRRDDNRFPMATLMEAVASEPVSAFSCLRATKLVELRLPASLITRCPGQRWPHSRIRRYLEVGADHPIIGTIVKPKTGLTPEQFSRAVVEAALAGARFTKADENMHMRLSDIPRFVGRTVRELEAAGFDLGRGPSCGKPRFLFAPHITTDSDLLLDYARAAVDAGANALMFTPYYAGGFLALSRVAAELDVPVYAHTAGMNVFTGCVTWGIDARICYLFAALFGASFMQLPAVKGYIRPHDDEKPPILATLRAHGLAGDNGMTLVVAGGLGPANIGRNMQALGTAGRMYLAGTSVYAHPEGPSRGVAALLLASRAFHAEGITHVDRLLAYARDLGAAGKPLVRALTP